MNQQEQLQKYQQIQQQIEQVQDYVMQVEDNINEMEETAKAAKNIENEEVGSEILVPIGSGAFVVGELKETDKIVTNIGGEAFEKKTVGKAVEILEGRKEQLQETHDELQDTIEQLQAQMQEIQQHLQQARQDQE